MCGIFGIISRPGSFQSSQVRNALDLIKHRGPDDAGIQSFRIGDTWEIWLSQRRLSIIDLSPAGHQPMLSGQQPDSKTNAALVFNGEIYNHKELKSRYQGRWNFHSRTDTETLLAGLVLEEEQVLKRSNGMLAFGFLDLNKQLFMLGRDRVGKKPLYVYQHNDVLVFASELKPITALGLPLDIDEEALAMYRWLGYVPAERTIYKQCKKLPAASFAKIDLQQRTLGKLKPQLYWDPLKGYGEPFKGSYEDAKEQLSNLIDNATKIRLESDVPLGVFLSGGIDSSLVIASVAAQTSGSVSGFTVKFDDPDFDESPVAIDTARRLGINLEVLKLSPQDFERQLGKIPTFYDEPFSDSSQIPTLAIAEAAKKHVSVVLTGDGGDEVFLGYPRYSNQARIKRVIGAVKSVPGLKSLILALTNSPIGRQLFILAMSKSGMAGAKTNLDSKIARLNALLSLKSLDQIYESVMCVHQREWLDSTTQAHLGHSPLKSLIKQWYPDYGWDALESRSLEEQAAALDLVTYMRDDVLVKVDRATMAYSLEARSPLLDYRIVEFGCSLPKEFKLHKGVHKRILRDVLATRVQGDILKLGKKGFGVPLPGNLPAGPTPYAQWNKFIEQQWRESRLLPNT